MSDDHQLDCDLTVYGEGAQEVLCTCNLPMSDSSAHPLAKRALLFSRYIERRPADREQLESARRRDLAEWHIGATLWVRWKARLRLALAAWRMARQRRRLRR